MGILNWIKRILGSGKKKTIAIDIETGGLEKGKIYITDAYKVSHPKDDEAMEALLKKIEDNKRRMVSGGKSMSYDSSVVMHLGKKKYQKDNEMDTSFIESAAIGYATDSTVAGALLGGDILGAMVGDMLNSSDDSSSSSEPIEREFDGGFGGGEYSGGGAGGDYGSSSSSYDSGTDYDSGSSDYSSSSSDDY